MGDALYVASRWFLVRAGKIFFPTCSAKNHLLACVHEGGGSDTARYRAS